MVYHAVILWMDSFIELEEFLGFVSLQEKSLHGGNFESFLKNLVKNFPSLPILKDMRFDQAQGAIGQKATRTSVSCLVPKENPSFHLTTSCIHGAVHSILYPITSKQGPDRSWIFRFCGKRVFMTNYLLDLGNWILSHDFKANNYIRAQKLLDFMKVWALASIRKKF